MISHNSANFLVEKWVAFSLAEDEDEDIDYSQEDALDGGTFDHTNRNIHFESMR